jgi:hypothetical protein
VTARAILLLDVDGVLVHPVGYKEALRATIDVFAAQMGLPPMGPRHDEIAIFEACGFTNEWDSGAVCVATILLAALDQRPDLRRKTLDATFAAIRDARLTIARPDFVGIAREVLRWHGDGQFPAARTLELLSARRDGAPLALLTALLGNVYDAIGTPTTRLFQTHTLGSARFEATYGQPAPLQTESYLLAHDVPLLSADNRDRLLNWRAQPGNGAAIFTARPSLPPADLGNPPPTVPTSGQPAGYAPEAELAAELLGLNGKIPLLGQGRVSWLAQQTGRGTADYIKPSPVQSLAAIGAAVSGVETEALRAAAALFEQHALTGPLAALRGGVARVAVFEDTTGGIRATRTAVDLLRRAGVDARFEAVGVSPHPDKRAALVEVADHVVDDVNAGLPLIWG